MSELSAISLISHPSKIMLRVILNRLKAKAEDLLAEEQAGCRPGRSTVQQIFNSPVIIEKHLQHQRGLFNNFTDFKKLYDRVWHVSLWQVLKSLDIEEGLLQAIQALYNFSSAVLVNSQLGEFFEATVGVCQGCLLSSTLFNFFSGEDHAGNTLRPPHIHLHLWKVHMQPMICRRHCSYGRQ